jgi:RimJ/RimL family protein N-acetyltransferase
VKEWHSLTPAEWQEQSLVSAVTGIMTQRVTEALPPAWRGEFTVSRARAWIEERDREGLTLLAVLQETGAAVGLVIVHEAPVGESPGIELRIGYMLSEGSWGTGLGTELVKGLVGWARDNGVVSILGGVERTNMASRRVLEKSGFVLAPTGRGDETEELTYQWKR